MFGGLDMPVDSTVSQIILALGGLGLFLYGMKLLGDGLELAAGAKLRKILEKITSNRWLGALVGIVVTAIIQSSTAVSVMVVGFVNASLMSLSQAMGVLMGATIGTTVTSLILSFNLSQYAPVFIFIGAFMVVLSKKNNTKYAGQIIAGFGILFFGMTTMSSNLKPLAESDVFKQLISSISNPFLGILFGIAFAALIQSSSAGVGILQALGAAGALMLGDSVFMIYGIHIGACVTAVISSIGATKDAKRTALSYVLFTLFGTAIFTVITLLTPFTSLVQTMFPKNVSLQISFVHIISTVVATIVLLPCVNLITKISCLIIPGGKDEEEKEACRLKFIDQRLLKTPPIAVNQVTKEINRMSVLSNKNFKMSMEALLNKDDKIITKVSENEEVIDYLNHSITSFLVQINGLPLEDHDLLKIGSYYHIVSDIERIGDHAENICEIASRIIENNEAFSEKAIEEIKDLSALVESVITDSFDLFFERSDDPLLLERISNNEQDIDDKTEQYKDNHIERLSKGECNAMIGTLFMELLTNLERIADHSTNIAFSLSPQRV